MTITGKKIGYIRVSTVDQNPERQLDNITLHKKFIDYATGGSMDRPQLQLLKEFVREDDILYIHSMDRLGRKVKDIRDLVDFFLAKGVQVEFVKENLRFTSQQDALSNCILNILGAVAEFEHALIRERQMEGIKIAAKQGKYKNKGIRVGKGTNERLQQLLFEGRTSKEKIAMELGMSRSTIYRRLEELRKQKQIVIQGETIEQRGNK